MQHMADGKSALRGGPVLRSKTDSAGSVTTCGVSASGFG